MKRSCVALAGWIAVSLASPAQAQVVLMDGPRWTVTVSLGASKGVAAEEMATALRTAGYTDTLRGCGGSVFCFPDRISPESHSSHGNPALLSLRRHVGKRVAIEALLGGVAGAQAIGWKVDTLFPWSSRDRVTVDHDGTFSAVLLSIESRPVRLAVGPALFRGNWTYTETVDGSVDRVRGSAFGIVGGAGFIIPLGSRLALELTGQYRGFGTVAVRSPNLPAPRIRTFDANPSHAYMGVGISLRW